MPELNTNAFQLSLSTLILLWGRIVTQLWILKNNFLRTLLLFFISHLLEYVTSYRFRSASSIKHHFQSSPGSYDFITGCPVSLKCFVPCLLGDESQHPTWPHVKHNRNCTQLEPIFSHSSHPLVLPRIIGFTWSIWVHLVSFIMFN